MADQELVMGAYREVRGPDGRYHPMWFADATPEPGHKDNPYGKPKLVTSSGGVSRSKSSNDPHKSTEPAELEHHSMVGLVRLAGYHGLDAGQTRLLLKHLGKSPSDATIKTQLSQGRKGINVPSPAEASRWHGLVAKAKAGDSFEGRPSSTGPFRAEVSSVVRDGSKTSASIHVSVKPRAEVYGLGKVGAKTSTDTTPSSKPSSTPQSVQTPIHKAPEAGFHTQSTPIPHRSVKAEEPKPAKSPVGADEGSESDRMAKVHRAMDEAAKKRESTSYASLVPDWHNTTDPKELTKGIRGLTKAIVVRGLENPDSDTIRGVNNIGRDMTRMFKENPGLDPKKMDRVADVAFHAGNGIDHSSLSKRHAEDMSSSDPLGALFGSIGMGTLSALKGFYMPGVKVPVLGRIGNGIHVHTGTALQGRLTLGNGPDMSSMVGSGNSGGGDSTHADVDATTTFRHEYGHHLEAQFPEARKRFEQIYHSQPKSHWESGVSQYGSTNPSELWAESFAAATHPDYNRAGSPQLPKELHDFWQPILKGDPAGDEGPPKKGILGRLFGR